MIQLDIRKPSQSIFVPLPVPGPATDAALTARSTSDNTVVAFDIVTAFEGGFLLQLMVCLPEEGFHEGEWEYTLAYVDEEGKEQTATGILNAYGDGAGVKEYDKEIYYKQYGE